MRGNSNNGRFHDRDYRWSGHFLITILAYKRQRLFSEIIKGHQELYPIGEIIKKEWINTEIVRAYMNVKVGAFVIMPDHFHGILYIGRNEFNSGPTYEMKTNSFGPQSNNLGSIIRGLKSSVTVGARGLGITEKIWQPRYNERWLRSEAEVNEATWYIRNNPKRWKG